MICLGEVKFSQESKWPLLPYKRKNRKQNISVWNTPTMHRGMLCSGDIMPWIELGLSFNHFLYHPLANEPNFLAKTGLFWVRMTPSTVKFWKNWQDPGYPKMAKIWSPVNPQIWAPDKKKLVQHIISLGATSLQSMAKIAEIGLIITLISYGTALLLIIKFNKYVLKFLVFWLLWSKIQI